ncbi:hypothetical protein V8B97DRAFT_330301 [Scleroderma yunnanense]
MGHPTSSSSPLPGSASDRCEFSTKPRSITPLYTLAKPLLWRQSGANTHTRSRFEGIRSRFYKLLGLSLDATKDGKNQKATLIHRLVPRLPRTNKQLKEREHLISFFTDLFGGDELKDYIGDIAFFGQLATDVGNPSASTDGLEVQEATHDSRSKELAATLLKSMSINEVYNRRFWLSENKKLVARAELISKSLGFAILQDLSAAYNTARDVFNSYSGEGENVNNSVGHPRFASIESMVEDVKLLQDKLSVTEDDDEKRALEEDITGKILLACWCGIHSEIEPILAKVVEHILKDETVPRTVLSTRVALLERFGRILEAAIAEPPEDYQVHLRRHIEASATPYRIGYAGSWKCSQCHLGEHIEPSRLCGPFTIVACVLYRGKDSNSDISVDYVSFPLGRP